MSDMRPPEGILSPNGRGGASRNAIITGASSGIGHALAIELGRRGWRTALLARRKDLLENVASDVRGIGGDALALAADVTDAGAVQKSVDQTIAAWGPLHLAVANAGLSVPSAAARLDLEVARDIMRINFEGMLNLVAAVIPGMVERGQGQFAGISSLAGFRGLPGAGPYSASKAAMRAYLEAIRIELAPRGIAVTTVNPGFIRTPMTEKNRFPMPFLMNVEDAARRIADAIEAKRREVSFPLPMALMMRLVRILPNAVWERVSLPYARRDARRAK